MNACCYIMYCHIAGLSRLRNYWGKHQTRRELSKRGGGTFLDSRGHGFSNILLWEVTVGMCPRKTQKLSRKMISFLQRRQNLREKYIHQPLWKLLTAEICAVYFCNLNHFRMLNSKLLKQYQKQWINNKTMFQIETTEVKQHLVTSWCFIDFSNFHDLIADW